MGARINFSIASAEVYILFHKVSIKAINSFSLQPGAFIDDNEHFHRHGLRTDRGVPPVRRKDKTLFSKSLLCYL